MNTKKIISAFSRFQFTVSSGPQVANKIDTFIQEPNFTRKAEDAEPLKPFKTQTSVLKTGSDEWMLLLCIHKHSSARNLTKLQSVFKDKFIKRYKFGWPLDPIKCLQVLKDRDLIQLDNNNHFNITQKGRSTAIHSTKSCPDEYLKSSIIDPSLLKSYDPDCWFDFISQPNTATSESPSLSDQIISSRVILKIDIVERLSLDYKIIQESLMNRNIEVERTKLWVGDYQWVLRVKMHNAQTVDYSLGIVVERKRADDLAASIIDGRYQNQKNKLKKSGARCIYLLEGTRPSIDTKITKGTLIQSLISTHFYYSFPMKITKDLDDTFNWLARMTVLLKRETSSWPENVVLSLQSFTEFSNSTNPSKSLTIGDIFANQLRSIKQCGENSTIAILKHFPTPRLLYNAIKSTQTTNNPTEAMNTLFTHYKLRKDLKSKLMHLFS